MKRNRYTVCADGTVLDMFESMTPQAMAPPAETEHGGHAAHLLDMGRDVLDKVKLGQNSGGEK